MSSSSASDPLSSTKLDAPPKFDGKGSFHLWKARFISFLNIKNLSSLLQDPDSEDDEKAAESVKETKTKAQRLTKLNYFLMISLSDDVLAKLVHLDGDPIGMYRKLLSIYESGTTANRVSLREQLNNAYIKNEESFDSFVGRLNTLRTQLTDVGEEPKESEMIYTVLRGVKSKYKSVVDTLKITPPKITDGGNGENKKEVTFTSEGAVVVDVHTKEKVLEARRVGDLYIF